MGDSYTDEYRFYPVDRARARNWVEILAALRGADFGAFSQRSRGLPRDQGFATNWALQNSTSDDLIILGQHTGLAAQVRAGRVRHVVLFIGGNDFLLKAFRTPNAIAALPGIVSDATRNVATALDTILAAGPDVRVVVVTISNVAYLPVARPLLATPLGPTLVSTFGAATDQYNANLRLLAGRDPRVAVADFGAAVQGIVSGSPLVVGGVTIDTVNAGDGYRNLVLGDGIHLGTVAQGLLANLIVGTFNASFGTGFRPLGERELIAYAAAIDRATAPPPPRRIGAR